MAASRSCCYGGASKIHGGAAVPIQNCALLRHRRLCPAIALFQRSGERRELAFASFAGDLQKKPSSSSTMGGRTGSRMEGSSRWTVSEQVPKWSASTPTERRSFDSAASSSSSSSKSLAGDNVSEASASSSLIIDNLLLISPFFFWGTAMVAMKGVLPKAGPFFVASTRLVPAGCLLVAFAAWRGRKQPSGLYAWLSIIVFSIIDASCFQGFLAAGLDKTSAGLGSVIIDSQPLTVAIVASILFNEKLPAAGVAGLVLGVAGLLLLEVPAESIQALLASKDGLAELSSASSFWSSGEWYMLLAAQSMAAGTLLVRWVCKFVDPIMATGWHMIIGGFPLLFLAATRGEPALDGHLEDLQAMDWAALGYTSLFGSAVSYGVFFYNATKGSLTKLSSLTFLTPMFAALFGYILLDESLDATQILGATITLAGIYLVNARSN